MAKRSAPFKMSVRSATITPPPTGRPITPLEFEKPLVELEKMLAELKVRSEAHEVDLGGEITKLEKKIAEERAQIYTKLTPWQRVQIVRHPQRPYFLDYAQRLFTDFTELSGDRVYGNDRATVGGLATLDGQPVMVIGQQKGRDTKENLLRNFGMSHPEGYRKALRLMRLADKFGLPILCFIDTPGAYPGLASEERHVGEAIAVNLREMFTLKVPIIATVLGEGGSGGALGIGIADRVLLMENAYYSVISPEGCASILWHSASQAPLAAEAMKISSTELLKMKLVEEVVAEPLGGAHRDWDGAAAALKEAILKHLRQLQKLSVSALQDGRYEKFRQYGEFEERAGKASK